MPSRKNFVRWARETNAGQSLTEGERTDPLVIDLSDAPIDTTGFVLQLPSEWEYGVPAFEFKIGEDVIFSFDTGGNISTESFGFTSKGGQIDSVTGSITTQGGRIFVRDLSANMKAELNPTVGVITAVNSVPADNLIASGSCAIWFDKTNGAAKLMIKGKTTNGTVVTGSVSLV